MREAAARPEGDAPRPPLTRAEVQEVRARASADLRTVGNYVSYRVARHLVVSSNVSNSGVSIPSEELRSCSMIFLWEDAPDR
jgi:hypothetical protein